MLARAEDGEFWLRYFIPSMVSIFSIALNLCVGGAIIVWNVPLIGLCLVASFVMALVIEHYAANKIVAKERDLRPLLSESTTTKNHFRYKEQMKAILSLGMGKPLILNTLILAKSIRILILSTF